MTNDKIQMTKKYNPEYFMNLALDLALKAKGSTSPNPLVGAVIVNNNKVIATGFHKKAGTPHAEVIALNKAGRLAKNATLYVNLEPCSHFGRTPPCIDKIISSGIKKVIIGMIDPNPLNNTKGIAILKKAGTKVKCGVLKNKCYEINKPFIKFITKGIPYITVKVGQSLDGKIATRNYDSKWITSEQSRSFAHKLRDEFDAVVIGINTVLKDDPCLDTKKAARVIIDSELRIPEDATLFNNDKTKVIIATNQTQIDKTFGPNVKIIFVRKDGDRLDLLDLLNKLAVLNFTNILIEGGGEIIGSLFDKRLVDEVKFFIAPKIIGGRNAINSVMGEGVEKIDSAIELKDLKINNIGKDFLAEAKIVYRDN